MSLTKVDTGRTYSVEEFMTLPLDPGQRYELVRGVIREMSHPGEEHTRVSGRLLLRLGVFAEAHQLGEALPPGGFKLTIPGDPKATLRAPDVAFVAQAKLTGQIGAFEVVPNLAVEVYSSQDEPGDLREKLGQYQAAGWDLVWVVYPPKSSPQYKAATVDIYRLKQSLVPVQTLQAQEELDGAEVLPGFKLPVSALFN